MINLLAIMVNTLNKSESYRLSISTFPFKKKKKSKSVFISRLIYIPKLTNDVGFPLGSTMHVSN